MDVFNLAAKLTLDTDQYDRGLGEAENRFSVFGDVLKGNLATEAIMTGLNLVANAAKTAAEGLVNFVKDSVTSYADYEQLVGGVQKLYGNMGLSVEEYAAQNGKSVEEVRDEWQRLEDAQNLVMQNAENAYKTSGMSMNEYMESATSFSASLINSLGGDTREAAELTDVAMQNISDNFNTFGGDIGMIQGAFQGFAKQNYTMLDNLKLGYGGTKSEMERLIADANEYAATIGETSDLSINSFADIVKAIDLVQRKQNIRGTTAREAEKTIQGSINTTKAAYKNLLTAIGGGGDVDQAFDNFVSSFENTVNNIIPVIERIIPAIGKIIEKIAPLVEKYLPQFIAKVSPLIVDAITIIGGALLDLLGELLPKLGSWIWGKIKEFGAWLAENDPFINSIVLSIEGMKVLFTEFFNAIVQFVKDAWEKIKEVWDTVSPYFVAIWEAIKNVFSTVAETLGGFFSTAWDDIKLVWDLVTDYFQNIWDSIKLIFEVVADVFHGDFKGAWDKIREIVDLWEGYFKNVWEAIKTIFTPVADWFKDKFSDAKEKIVEMWDKVSPYFDELWKAIKNTFANVKTWFQSKFGSAWDAIKKVWDLATGYFRAIWETIKTIFEVVKDVLSGDFQGAWDGIQEIVDLWEGYFSDVWEAIKEVFSTVAEWFGEKFQAAWDAIKKPFDTVGNFFGGIKESIANAFSGDSYSWGAGLGYNFINGLNNSGIYQNLSSLQSSIYNALSSMNSINGYGWGADMMYTYSTGMANNVNKVVDVARSVADGVKNLIGFSEPDEGPLSDFHTYAPDMMKLFAQGIRDNEDLVKDQVAKSFDFGDLIDGQGGIDANISGVRATPSSPIEINIYATERQDEQEIAREVQRVLVQWENQRKAAYA